MYQTHTLWSCSLLAVSRTKLSVPSFHSYLTLTHTHCIFNPYTSSILVCSAHPPRWLADLLSRVDRSRPADDNRTRLNGSFLSFPHQLLQITVSPPVSIVLHLFCQIGCLRCHTLSLMKQKPPISSSDTVKYSSVLYEPCCLWCYCKMEEVISKLNCFTPKLWLQFTITLHA